MGEGRGGGAADYVRYLVRIWGELQNFDKTIFDQDRASAPLIVSVRRLMKRKGKKWTSAVHAELDPKLSQQDTDTGVQNVPVISPTNTKLQM